MKGPQPKDKRNNLLYEAKSKMTFAQLAKYFNVSECRAKEIYYREDRRRNPGKKKSIVKTKKEG